MHAALLTLVLLIAVVLGGMYLCAGGLINTKLFIAPMGSHLSKASSHNYNTVLNNETERNIDLLVRFEESWREAGEAFEKGDHYLGVQRLKEHKKVALEIGLDPKQCEEMDHLRFEAAKMQNVIHRERIKELEAEANEYQATGQLYFAAEKDVVAAKWKKRLEILDREIDEREKSAKSDVKVSAGDLV